MSETEVVFCLTIMMMLHLLISAATVAVFVNYAVVVNDDIYNTDEDENMNDEINTIKNRTTKHSKTGICFHFLESGIRQ